MNIVDILTITDRDEVIKIISESNAPEGDPAGNQAIYEGEHEISNRLDKPKTDSNGAVIGSTTVAKLVLNYQKKIVEGAVAFLFGVPVNLSKTTEGSDEAFKVLNSTLRKLKWHGQNRELARVLFIQQRAAKLYFIKNPDEKDNAKISSMVLSNKNGSFYPNFDDTGDMDAFLRTYTKIAIVDGKEAEIEVFELYTADQIIKGEKTGGEWAEDVQANIFLKIPVVYYEQDKEEWGEVQGLIDNQELTLSKLADTNEYFSAPIIKLFGDVEGAPNKEDQGKSLNCKMTVDQQGNQVKSDAEYLTWDQRPESLKLQFDMVEKYIFSFSQTPDISFSNMLENKPGNISGVALKIMLLDSVIKSLNKQEIFEPNLQRELSVVQSMMIPLALASEADFLEMEIDIDFQSILPDNFIEIVEYLTQATGGKPIMTQASAVQKNPLVTNKDDEIAALETDDNIEAGTLNL